MTHEQLVTAIKARVLREAEERRTNAEYNGKWTDGGASMLEAQIKWYEYGAKGIIPPEWEEHARSVKKETDPEWDEFQRLRKKFEGGAS